MEETKTYFKNSDSSFILSHIVRNENYSMPRKHYHRYYEMYFLVSGEVNFFIKDRTYNATSGDLVLINADDLHKTAAGNNTTNVDRILIQFNMDFFSLNNEALKDVLLAPFTSGYPVITSQNSKDNYIKGLVYKMTLEAQQQDTGFEISLQAGLMQLLVYLTRHVSQISQTSFEHPSPMHQKVSEIVQYINKNYYNDISLSEISKAFYISTFYLTRVFKECTGFTFIDYLNHLRVKEAQKLLLNSDKKVIEIAEEVGFGSVSHFGRVFKEISGTSPLQYRLISK